MKYNIINGLICLDHLDKDAHCLEKTVSSLSNNHEVHSKLYISFNNLKFWKLKVARIICCFKHLSYMILSFLLCNVYKSRTQ